MVFEIRHARELTFMPFQHTVEKITKGLTRHINIVIPAMQKIHRHIKDIVDPLLITEIGVKHTGRHTAARGIGIGPGMRAAGQQP